MKKKLNPAYNETLFRYITINRPRDFWVVTAYNPDGTTTGSSDNIVADEKLQVALEQLGVTPFRIIGMSPDLRHAEPGWGFPASQSTALEIGRRFRQEAVFHFTEGRIDLVDCENGEGQSLEYPERRVQNHHPIPPRQ
jgi:hypothetical protein